MIWITMPARGIVHMIHTAALRSAVFVTIFGLAGRDCSAPEGAVDERKTFLGEVLPLSA